MSYILTVLRRYTDKLHVLCNNDGIEISIWQHIIEHAIVIYFYVVKWPDCDQIFVRTRCPVIWYPNSNIVK